MNFLRNLLATLTGLTIFTVLAFVVFLIFIGVATSEEKVIVKDNSILHLKLNRPIAERAFDDPFAELFAEEASSIGLLELLEAIEHAKTNDKIKGIYLESGYPMGGFASLEAIRRALNEFKESGKFITSYGEIYSEGGYYVSSVADEIYVNPRGYFEFNGIAANVTFLKGMFDKLEIKPQIFKVGDFKSAVEPFERKDMSDENREQLNSILGSIYGNLLKNVAESRSMEIDELKNISDNMLAQSPKDAVKLGLVSDEKYLDEVYDDLKDKLELEEDDKINFISFKDYSSTITNTGSSSNRIAVIVGSGEIHGGKSDNQTIGSTSFAKEIRKARTNDKVKAVVIRINSPGGSALASDVIWREIMLTKEVKPVIASMSDYAASGGYYMAMGADSILAEPNTVTGSIGVFMTLFNLEDFLENKLGITHDVARTGEYSDIYTVTRALTEGEKQILQNSANETYEDFTTKAAENRGMDLDELKAIASGRIWSGQQAVDNGLIDGLGGLNDAIEMAAAAAELEDDYKVRYYPPQKTFLEQILSDLGGEVSAKIMAAKAGELYPVIQELDKLKNLEGPQARMLYNFEFDF